MTRSGRSPRIIRSGAPASFSTPTKYPLWGIQRGGRTVVIYSAKDLSCYWNLANQHRVPAVDRAIKLGQNMIDYMTDRELPPDKLQVP